MTAAQPPNEPINVLVARPDGSRVVERFSRRTGLQWFRCYDVPDEPQAAPQPDASEGTTR